ncbi:hypothetical protein BDW42DRAFT_192970 [Aspergillus taichungensis]|uniref:WSC domain-containing protein n=1 Tax=Aspergillus taichungensis TaxID=482145 RepID=A0A2J5HYM2_9EURO|nr:hypothetical protein BDW42DRAFT_192970 [Aspergillus taichungensis]
MTSKVLSLAFISLALSTGTSATIRQGCYNSPGDLQLIGSDAAPKETSYLSPATCQQTCKKLNHKVFALHDANKCYCGDELPPFAAMVLDTECDEECAGYPGLNCGGKSAWTVLSSTIAVHHQPESKPKHRLQKRTSPIPAKDEAENEEDDGDISHIITASDDADYEPGHTLSVNPTIVQTGGSAPPSRSGSAKANNNSPEEPVQTSILTAPTAAPAKDGADTARVAASSTMVPVASGTASPSSSSAPSSGSGSSASSSPSASPGAGARNGVLVGAMVLPVVVGGWLA